MSENTQTITERVRDEMAAETVGIEEHHLLCMGVMAACYPHVPADLKQAIREGITEAEFLGLPVNARNLEKGGPLFSGGNA